MNKTAIQVLSMTLLAWCAAAQDSPTILEVEVENYVGYVADVTDPSKVARSPAPVQPSPPANFFANVILADVTHLNGASAKGTLVLQTQTLLLNSTPLPNGAIADVTRVASAQLSMELLNADGTPIGSIFATGLSGGAPAPGSPPSATGGNLAIVGGTGAFLGARGSVSSVEVVVPRATSQAENPSLRRINGGGRARFVLQVFPMLRPDVMVGANGPEVFHGDNVPVSAERPARPGEILALNARGLGSTRPGVNANRAFPLDTPAVIVSPVEVLVNGKPSRAISQIGAPGTTDRYRIEFRLPDDISSDQASIQVRAAWIDGAVIRIPVQ